MAEENKLILKISENFNFFGPMSILYGTLCTVCLYKNPNGILFPVFVIMTILFGIAYVKKIGLQIRKGTWFYMAGMVLLGISTFLTSSGFLVFFNLAGVFLLFIVMMIHQFYRDEEWTYQTYSRNLLVAVGTTIGSIFYPFKHAMHFLTGESSDRKKKVSYILTGGVIALVLLLIILPLLVHSDRIFEMYFGNITSYIRFGNVFWICMMTVMMTILCYAFFSALCRYNLNSNEKRKSDRANPIIGITFTSVIAVIYLFYSGIQIIYLFIGKAGSLPDGITYSSYARSGFWELLFVSVINFLMVIICTYLFEEDKFLKGILAVISACTFIMIFSAAYRMTMYVNAYHLTFLRVLVLWFLGLLTLIMAGTVFSIYRKNFPLFRYIMGITACCYILFSLARPDYWIAKYNVAHTENMNVEELSYLLYGLSDDAAPVIAEIDSNDVLDAEYDVTAEYMLKKYFQMIEGTYDNENIRKLNYSHVQAVKSAEEYLQMSK